MFILLYPFYVRVRIMKAFSVLGGWLERWTVHIDTTTLQGGGSHLAGVSSEHFSFDSVYEKLSGFLFCPPAFLCSHRLDRRRYYLGVLLLVLQPAMSH